MALPFIYPPPPLHSAFLLSFDLSPPPKEQIFLFDDIFKLTFLLSIDRIEISQYRINQIARFVYIIFVSDAVTSRYLRAQGS